MRSNKSTKIYSILGSHIYNKSPDIKPYECQSISPKRITNFSQFVSKNMV